MTPFVWLVVMLIGQVLDGMFTYVGVLSGRPEGNPICVFAFEHMGLLPGLVFVKVIASACSIQLYSSGHFRMLEFLTILMYVFAVLPWILILGFGV